MMRINKTVFRGSLKNYKRGSHIMKLSNCCSSFFHHSRKNDIPSPTNQESDSVAIKHATAQLATSVDSSKARLMQYKKLLERQKEIIKFDDKLSVEQKKSTLAMLEETENKLDKGLSRPSMS
jgi:hypothetical protein